MNSFEYDSVDPDQIAVYWQHPRTELENPVLLVWPNPVRDKWAAEVDVDEEVAWVVCHTTLYEDNDGDIHKASRTVNPNEPIPQCVPQALRQYDGEYGPIQTVANPSTDADKAYENNLLPDAQETLV